MGSPQRRGRCWRGPAPGRPAGTAGRRSACRTSVQWWRGAAGARDGAGLRRQEGWLSGQAGSYEEVLHALVLHVEPQPSLVLHIMITSGVVASTTRMSSSNSSSVTASAGASRTAVGGAIDITLLTVRRVVATWPGAAEPRAAQPGVGQEIVTTPYVFSLTAASADTLERSLPAGQYPNVGGSPWRPMRSHAWICSTIAVAASSPSRPYARAPNSTPAPSSAGRTARYAIADRRTTANGNHVPRSDASSAPSSTASRQRPGRNQANHRCSHRLQVVVLVRKQQPGAFLLTALLAGPEHRNVADLGQVTQDVAGAEVTAQPHLRHRRQVRR